MSKPNSEILVSNVVSQAWSKFANPDTQTSQFRYFFSILDEIESILNVEKFSVLSLQDRDNISDDIHLNGNLPLSLIHFEKMFESCTNTSLALSITKALHITKMNSSSNDSFSQKSPELFSNIGFNDPASQPNTHGTFIDPIPISSGTVNNQEPTESTKYSKLDSMKSTGSKVPLDTSTPLSVNKVRSFSKRKSESRWENGKRRTISSITLTPRNYNNYVNHDDEKNEEEDEERRREMTDLLDENIHSPTNTPRSRAASASSFQLYSNGDGDNLNNGFGSPGNRRASRKFLDHKRSIKDVRTISEQNDHISFLEDNRKKQESELKEKQDIISILERKCRDYDRQVRELEEAEIARSRQIDEVENVVKMTQRDMKYRRQHENRASEAFVSSIKLDDNDEILAGELHRRNSTGAFDFGKKFADTNLDTLDPPAPGHDSPSHPIYDYKNRRDKEKQHNNSTSPLKTAYSHLADTTSRRSHSDISPRIHKNGHRLSTSSVFSISPEETAADFDDKLDELQLENDTTTYLKELFRSSQQKVLNIVYNQLNDLKDLNSKLNDSEANVQYLTTSNEQLNNDYQIRLQQIEEFEQQIEEKYKNNCQNEVQLQVKELLAKMKEKNAIEREEERRALEAQMKMSLKEQVHQQSKLYLNQIHQLKTQIENQQQVQNELERQLKDAEQNIYEQAGRSNRHGTRSLQDELRDLEDESDGAELHPTTSLTSNISMPATPHYAALSLPTDGDGNLDFSTFLEKIVMPMAEEQGVLLKNIDHLQEFNNSILKKELDNLTNSKDTFKMPGDNFEFDADNWTKSDEDMSSSLTKKNDVSTPFSQSELFPKVPTHSPISLESKIKHRKKKLGSMSIAELAQYQYEVRKSRQKHQRAAHRLGHPGRINILKKIRGNLTHFVVKVLNRKLFIIISILVAFLLSVILTNNGVRYMTRWFWQKVGYNSEQPFTPSVNINQGSPSLSSFAKPSKSNSDDYGHQEIDENVWWSYLPANLKKLGNYIDQLAKPQHPPPV